ncbi:toprim domain-containing protein [Shewanella sp.]|uniref:toprim domain-containing protein n=1 Tax=Shewanella sp. TaxID=50422 RepID=UPI003F371C5F
MNQDILWQARHDIIALAAEVGIDGSALLNALPSSGQLLIGSQVPTLSPRYRGKCSVLFHIHQMRNGQSWPWMRLHTFKHGGVSRVFNGLQWQRQNRTTWPTTPHVGQSNSVSTPQKRPASATLADWRASRFASLQAQYQVLPTLTPTHPWLQQRFAGQLPTAVLQRCHLRANHQQLLLPLQHHHGEISGFQSLTWGENAQKRFWLRKQGLLTGSYALINGQPGPVALCEGVATALSIALAWPGKIYIGLCANNLAAVRAQITEKVVIFYDDDRWPPQYGNPGQQAALACRQARDILVGPQFRSEQQHSCPTDFNDLHQLAGIGELINQVRRHWTVKSLF